MRKKGIYERYLKAPLERAAGAAGLLALSPALLLISAAVFLDDPGPVLFTQKRAGKKKDGKITYFTIYKFRTMKTSTPKDTPTHLLTDPEKYITRVGKFLRRTSLDELPQLFNIARGELAVIGPRPALWNQEDLLAEREKYGANDVLPGLTGWAQINGRDELPIPEKARLDGEYAQNISFLFDARCFLGTVLAVLREDGVREGRADADGEKKILICANVAKEHICKFHLPLIRELSARGWTVDAACMADAPVPGVRATWPMSWKRSPFTLGTIKGIRELRKLVEREKYDIVYCHTPVGGLCARLACRGARRRGTKVIYCAHGLHFFKGAPFKNWLVFYPIEKLLSRFTDVFYTVNTEDFELVKKRFHTPTVRLVPEVGADMTRLHVTDRAAVRREVREELSLPQDAPVLIYVAELIPNKNQGMLLDTLRILRAGGADAYLLLVGPDHWDGHLQKKAEEAGMAPYVRFTGWRSDIGRLMAAADICTASSIREGFGINLAEAMACGLPVVASDNRGHRMIIKDGENGFLVPTGDADRMALRVSRLLTDRALYEKWSRLDASGYDCRVIARQLADRLEAE